MSSGEVLESGGDLRVVLFWDTDAREPYDDGSSPLLRLWYGHGWRGEHVKAITSFMPDGIDRIVEAAAQWGSDHDKFERYLRQNHGTTQVVWWDSRGNGGGEYVYVTFDTAQWRQAMGFGSDGTGPVNLDEYRAWCEGDVWGYRVERRREYTATDGSGDTIDRWEPVEDAEGRGIAGRGNAEQEARAAYKAEADS